MNVETSLANGLENALHVEAGIVFMSKKQQKVKAQVGKVKDKSENKPKTLNSYEAKETLRTSTGFSELDRVLGGGLVKGSLILLRRRTRNSENQHLFYNFVIK